MTPKGDKGRLTMIKFEPPSEWKISHAAAMARIPAGCGFGGRKERLMMGENSWLGRKVVRR